jgi:hypothetical protein
VETYAFKNAKIFEPLVVSNFISEFFNFTSCKLLYAVYFFVSIKYPSACHVSFRCLILFWSRRRGLLELYWVALARMILKSMTARRDGYDIWSWRERGSFRSNITRKPWREIGFLVKVARRYFICEAFWPGSQRVNFTFFAVKKK